MIMVIKKSVVNLIKILVINFVILLVIILLMMVVIILLMMVVIILLMMVVIIDVRRVDYTCLLLYSYTTPRTHILIPFLLLLFLYFYIYHSKDFYNSVILSLEFVIPCNTSIVYFVFGALLAMIKIYDIT